MQIISKKRMNLLKWLWKAPEFQWKFPFCSALVRGKFFGVEFFMEIKRWLNFDELFKCTMEFFSGICSYFGSFFKAYFEGFLAYNQEWVFCLAHTLHSFKCYAIHQHANRTKIHQNEPLIQYVFHSTTSYPLHSRSSGLSTCIKSAVRKKSIKKTILNLK